MKKHLTLAGFLAVILCASVASAHGVATTRADHIARMDKYKEMANTQRAVAKEHAEMKKDYRSNQAVIAKQVREKALEEMDKHCDEIISASNKLVSEYEQMALWHKERSAEFP